MAAPPECGELSFSPNSSVYLVEFFAKFSVFGKQTSVSPLPQSASCATMGHSFERVTVFDGLLARTCQGSIARRAGCSHSRPGGRHIDGRASNEAIDLRLGPEYRSAMVELRGGRRGPFGPPD